MKFANVMALGIVLIFSTMAASMAAQTASANLRQVIIGRVVAVSASLLTIRTPDHGPGLSHGPGIHSMLIIAGKTLQIDISHAAWHRLDGVMIVKPHILIGDEVTVYATQRQNGTYRASAVMPGSAAQSPPRHSATLP